MLRTGDEPIPGYRLVRKLGKGTFGEVWQAHAPGKISMALKFLDLNNQEGWKEFRAVQRVKRVRHANLVPIVGLWLVDPQGQVLDEERAEAWAAREERLRAASPGPAVVADPEGPRPNLLVLAMTMADKDLHRRLVECRQTGVGGVPLSELLAYLQDAAKAIDFLNSPIHDLGHGPVAMQHGDIKPPNIMVVGNAAQVSDFGLVRILGGSRGSTGTSGTLAYMAPELFAGKQPSVSTDQYALAVSYVELRTGALPFGDLTPGAVVRAHADSRLNLSRLPEEERRVVARALSRVPHDRYATAQDMVGALRQAAWGVTPETLPPVPGDDAESPRATPAASHGARLRATPAASSPWGSGAAAGSGSSPPAPSGVPPSPSATPRSPPVSATPPASVASAGHASRPASPAAAARRRPGWRLAGGLAAAALAMLGLAGFLFPKADTLSVSVLGTEPEHPRAGERLVIYLAAAPATDPVRYEYRTALGEDWREAPDGRIELPAAPAEAVTIEFRARRGEDVSAPVLRKWTIGPPNRPPVLVIDRAPEGKVRSGRRFTIEYRVTDPDQDEAVVEWRAAGDAAWQRVPPGRWDLATPAVARWQIEVRAVDAFQKPSAVVPLAWDVEPAISTAALAAEGLEATRAVGDHGTRIDSLLDLADACALAQEPDAALVACREALDLVGPWETSNDPDERTTAGRGLAVVAAVRARTGDLAGAAALVSRALRLLPAESKAFRHQLAWRDVGLAYGELGDIAKGLETMDRLTDDWAQADALRLLADVELRRGNLSGVRELIARLPKPADRAVALLELTEVGAVDLAGLDATLHAVAAEVEVLAAGEFRAPRCWAGLALARHRRGHVPTAREAFAAAERFVQGLTESTERATAWAEVAHCEVEAGLVAEPALALHAARAELTAHVPEAHRALVLARLSAVERRLGDLAHSDADLRAAQTALDAALPLATDDPADLETIGVIRAIGAVVDAQLARGEWNEALATAARCIDAYARQLTIGRVLVALMAAGVEELALVTARGSPDPVDRAAALAEVIRALAPEPRAAPRP